MAFEKGTRTKKIPGTPRQIKDPLKELSEVNSGEISKPAKGTVGYGKKMARIRVQNALMDHVLAENRDRLPQILDTALRMAQGGDKSMIKLVLEPWIKAAAIQLSEGESKSGGGVNIIIQPANQDKPAGTVVAEVVKDNEE